MKISHHHLTIAFWLGLIFLSVVSASSYKYYFLDKKTDQIACTQEAKLCPDGSYVARTGPKCEFVKCPDLSKSNFDIARWKTYRNEKYGFEVKYPTDWKVTRENEPLCEDGANGQPVCIESAVELSAGDAWFEVEKAMCDRQIDWNKWHLSGKKFLSKDVCNKEFIITLDIWNDNPMKEVYQNTLDKILSTFKFTNINLKTSGTVHGKVIIGPLCPVEPCNNPINPYEGKRLIFTRLEESIDPIINVKLSSDGSYSTELPVSNYSVTLSDCNYMGCSRVFPKTIRVETNKTLELNLDIDTGIR